MIIDYEKSTDHEVEEEEEIIDYGKMPVKEVKIEKKKSFN